MKGPNPPLESAYAIISDNSVQSNYGKQLLIFRKYADARNWLDAHVGIVPGFSIRRVRLDFSISINEAQADRIRTRRYQARHGN